MKCRFYLIRKERFVKRFYIDGLEYANVISTNDMFKLISTVDNVMGDCYEVPPKTTLTQCCNHWDKVVSKIMYSAQDPFCCKDKSEYGFQLDSDERDEDGDLVGEVVFVDLKTGSRKKLDYSDTFFLNVLR